MGKSSAIVVLLLSCAALVHAAEERISQTFPSSLRSLYVNPGAPDSFQRAFISHLKEMVPAVSILTDDSAAEATVELFIYQTRSNGSSKESPVLKIEARVITRGSDPQELLRVDSGNQTELKAAARKVAEELARGMSNTKEAKASLMIPNDSTRPSAEDTEELFAQAAQLSMAQEYEQAIPFWRRYIELVPENSYAHFNLALTYLGITDWKNSAKYFESSLRLNRHNDSAFFNLALSYYHLSRWRDARVASEEALKINPAHDKARKLLEMLKTR